MKIRKNGEIRHVARRESGEEVSPLDQFSQGQSKREKEK